MDYDPVNIQRHKRKLTPSRIASRMDVQTAYNGGPVA